MPGERGRSGPGGIAVRMTSLCYSDSFSLKCREYPCGWLFVKKDFIVFQGKRGPPGNIGKPGPMVSQHSHCRRFILHFDDSVLLKIFNHYTGPAM